MGETLLTILCEDVMAIRNELAVYVSDQMGAVPVLKKSEVVLSPIEDNEPLDKDLAVTAIREYLESMGEGRHFDVMSAKDRIFIRSVGGHTIDKATRPSQGMFSCPHCGFMTKYESEHSEHMKLHYML